MYPPSPYDTKITLSPPTPGESSDNNRDDIQIYWQASQSGSSMEHTFGASSLIILTAFNAPSVMVDFSAFVAPKLRK